MKKEKESDNFYTPLGAPYGPYNNNLAQLLASMTSSSFTKLILITTCFYLSHPSVLLPILYIT